MGIVDQSVLAVRPLTLAHTVSLVTLVADRVCVPQKAFPTAGGPPAAPPAAAPPSYQQNAPMPPSYGGGYNAPPPGNAAYGTPPPQGPMSYQGGVPSGPASYNRPPGPGPAAYDRPPPQQSQPPPSGPAGYGAPPPGSGQMPASAIPDQAAVRLLLLRPAESYECADTFSALQLIQQVMSMTDEQINGLDETSRNTILQIVSLSGQGSLRQMLTLRPAFAASTSTRGYESAMRSVRSMLEKTFVNHR